MSIRLRLTLLYSFILALMLITFSIVLYLIQARTTLNDTKADLARRADYLVTGPLTNRSLDRVLKPEQAKMGAYTQICDMAGNVLGRSPNLGENLILPLSQAGLQAAQRGETVVEVAQINTERLLVHNQPFAYGADQMQLILQVATSLADQDQTLNTLGRILMAGSSVAVIVTFGIGWLLAGWTLQPIGRLQQTARAIGAERDFNRRVDYRGPNDEIGQLVTTFNNMLVELQAAYIQIEETLQTQRRFVADASHELRTPLTTLRGNISLLKRQPPISAEDRADILDDMVEETQRLMRLVNDLLALARADAGRPLHREPVQLKPLIEGVYQQIKLLAPERSIICQSALDATIIADSDALRQVLLVLFDNALKHTPAETTITLTASRQDEDIVIQVKDNGPGIAAAHLPHLFDRFYRGDTARSSPGAGLGLAIAAELVKAQDGVITVESHLGQGTTFTLRFPRYLAG